MIFGLTSQTFAIGGDPTFYGWLVCIAYLVTSWYCFKKGKQLDGNISSMLFWFGLAILMLILGLNKQLDLQTYLVNMIKTFVKDHGLYMYKKQIQHVLVVVLACTLMLTLTLSCFIFADAWNRFKVAWLGIFVLFCFIFLRFAYFDHEARSLLDFLGGYYKLFELVGILLILYASKLKDASAK